MTITNQQSAVTTQGNGSTTSFTFNFLIPTSASCQVQIYDTTVTPATTSSVTASLFTVSGVGVTTGGVVSYPLSGSPLSSGQYLTISRVLPIVQETTIRNQGNFYPAAVENALDNLTMIAQQLQQDISVLESQYEDPPAPVTPSNFLMADNIAQLRQVSAANGTLVYVQGHTTAGDGGAGFFRVTTTNPGTDDNGFIVHLNETGFYAVRQVTENAVIPEFFGAAGDGVTNDTTPMQSCFSASCNLGLTVMLKQEATYLVGPAATSSSVILTLVDGLTLQGNGATIKVKNNAGNYYAIMGNTTTASLSDLYIYDTIFDHNISNNAFSTTATINAYPQFTVCVRAGDNLVFERNTVKNLSNINSLFYNGNTGTGTSAVNYIAINDNLWLNVGANPNNVVHDHSTIYAVGKFLNICRNRFEASSLAAPSAVAAIETHGTVYTVCENQVFNYQQAMNLTGVYDAGDSAQGVVADNASQTLFSGIRMFSVTYQTHTSGFGIDGLLISDNYVRIKQSSYTGSEAWDAIVMRSGSTMPARAIKIQNNWIEYDEETSTTSYTGTVASVGFVEASSNITFSACEISYNTIRNAPLIAIALGFGNGTFDDAVIGPNTIVNPGSTNNGAAGTYRAAVWLGANTYTGSLTVQKQTIIDEFVTSRMVYGIYAIPTTTSSTIPCTWEFDLKLAGSTTSSFSQPVTNVTSRLTPLVNGVMNSGWSIPAQTFKAHSRILDTANNIEYRTPTDTSTWIRYTYTASIPGNSVPFGSIAWNTAPQTSGFIGWVYTTASGWKTWGAISA